MAAAAILYFQKVLFGPHSPLHWPYLSVHQIWCKFIKNWPRYALLCIFQDSCRPISKKWHVGPPVTLVLLVSISIPHLVQIEQELAEIRPFVYFQKWRPPSWISKKCYFGSPVTLVLYISISVPNLVQISPDLADIRPFVYFSRWRPPKSWISKMCYFGQPMTRILHIKFKASLLWNNLPTKIEKIKNLGIFKNNWLN